MSDKRYWKSLVELEDSAVSVNGNEFAAPIIDPVDLQEGDEDVARGLILGCRMFLIFQVIADEAGADLTNESVAAAIAVLDQFSVPGQPFSSLSDVKFDSNDSFALVAFNPDLGVNGGFDELTEIQDVTP